MTIKDNTDFDDFAAASIVGSQTEPETESRPSETSQPGMPLFMGLHKYIISKYTQNITNYIANFGIKRTQ